MQDKPVLYVLCGLPFSGKTTLQRELAKRFGFQVVSVDAIMDEQGMWEQGHPTQEDWNAAYSQAYRQIAGHLAAGATVIFDCANLLAHERENARKIAESLGAVHRLIYVNTSEEEIRRRCKKNEEARDREAIDQQMLENAFRMFDEPTESERPVLHHAGMNLDKWTGTLTPLEKD